MFIEKILEYFKNTPENNEKNKFSKPEGYKNLNTSSTNK